MAITTNHNKIAALLILGWSVTFLVVCLLHVQISSPLEESLPPPYKEAAARRKRSAIHDHSISQASLLSAAGSSRENNQFSSNRTKISTTTDFIIRQRFPVFGTKEFAQRCGWTIPRDDDDDDDDKQQRKQKQPKCIFYITIDPRDIEGISAWTSRIAEAFMLARQPQAGCQLLFDYGRDLDISEVLTPWPPQPQQSSLRRINYSNKNNWTVPSSNFSCASGCYATPLMVTHNNVLDRIIKKLQTPFSRVPNYRWAYCSDKSRYITQSRYEELTRVLPGFDLETGMACSLGALFRLAPTAARFEPRLFSDILPNLRGGGSSSRNNNSNNQKEGEKDLVMALYIRTGLTDVSIIHNRTVRDDEWIQNTKRVIENCALPLEQRYLSSSSGNNNNDNVSFSRVVWMVITDNPTIKHWTVEHYNATTTTTTTNAANNNDTNNNHPTVIHREVLMTASRGAFTGAKFNPSLVDFAEAFLDWYLLGESDFVLSYGSVSFSATASQRTARPLYLVEDPDNKDCTQQSIGVREEEE